VPEIEWFKEDHTQIKSSDKRYEMSYETETGTAKLIIKNALLVDEMSYKCVATNRHGTAKTFGVLVIKENKALRSPTHLARSPNSATTAGDQMRTASPLRKIDVPVSHLMPVLEESEHSDTQTDASAKSAENSTRLAVSPAAKISPVREEELGAAAAPCRVIQELPGNVEVKEGEDLKLSCTIRGGGGGGGDSANDTVEIVWFKDNRPIKDDYRIDIYSDRMVRYLEICDVRPSDAGEYTIVAKCSQASVQSTASITVLDNPSKLKRPNIEGLYQYNSRFFILT
jgi:hypothetical protein